MDIVNHVQLTERLASSGQPTAAQLGEIAAAGYEVVVNLAMPDHEQSIDEEGSLVTGLGMQYLHIPVPFDAPEEAHLAAFSGYLDAVKERKVWVHCIVNMRVSAFMYRYLQERRGWTAEQATTPILRGWLPQMDPVWQDFVGRAPVPPALD